MKYLSSTELLYSIIAFYLKWTEGKQNRKKFLSWAVDFTRKCIPMAQELGWNGGPDMHGKTSFLMITPGWYPSILVWTAPQIGRIRTRRLGQASWKGPITAPKEEFAEGSLPIQQKGSRKHVWQKVSSLTSDCQLPSYFKWETGTETSSATVGKNSFTAKSTQPTGGWTCYKEPWKCRINKSDLSRITSP